MSNNINAEFGRAVVSRRERLHITQQDLAQILSTCGLPSLTQQALSKIERGRRRLYLDQAIAISNALHMWDVLEDYREEPNGYFDLREAELQAQLQQVETELRDLRNLRETI